MIRESAEAVPGRGSDRFSRRNALRSLFAAPLTGGLAAHPIGLQGRPMPLRRLLDELAVTEGPFSGAFRSMPNGPVNWYFANLGLYFFADSDPGAIRGYMDAFLRASDPIRNTIDDVDPDLCTRLAPDSHDAYAGSFLRLAVKYTRSTSDTAWWSVNLPQLKAIAYSNICTQVKPNGCVRAFRAPHPNGIGYLMDQCEVYAGLREFAELLLETGDIDARYYAGFPPQLGIAIHRLFDSSRNAWKWNDESCPDGSAWYPDLTAQIYPHLYDVHSDDAPADYYRLNRGFDVLAAHAPDWCTRPQDIYPWLVAGYYAATRGRNIPAAMQMLDMVRRYYLPGAVNTGRLTIADLGYCAGIMRAASHSGTP